MTALPRHDLDFYPTPGQLTLALLDLHSFVGWHGLPTVFEPCAGDGAISRVMQECGEFRLVDTADIDPGQPVRLTMDATDQKAWSRVPLYDWVISNPPYKQASQILPLALASCRVGMAMLLRLSYLEPCQDRAQWLADNPPAKLIIFNPRPKFRADCTGSDSVTSAWFIWHRYGKGTGTELVFSTNWRNYGGTND